MSIRLITGPSDYPVTLAEAKAHCRIDGTDEDALIEGLISAATEHVELYTGRAILSQTWEVVCDTFSDVMVLPKGPVTAITSIKYIDTAGDEQTLAGANYQFDSASDPQRIVKAPDYSWPDVSDNVNSVVIRFVTGSNEAPKVFKQAILLLVGQWYDNRAAAAEKSLSALPNAVEALLTNHRSFAF